MGSIGGKGRVRKNRVRATHVPGQDKEDNQEPLLLIIINLAEKVKFQVTSLVPRCLWGDIFYRSVETKI